MCGQMFSRIFLTPLDWLEGGCPREYPCFYSEVQGNVLAILYATTQSIFLGCEYMGRTLAWKCFGFLLQREIFVFRGLVLFFSEILLHTKRSSFSGLDRVGWRKREGRLVGSEIGGCGARRMFSLYVELHVYAQTQATVVHLVLPLPSPSSPMTIMNNNHLAMIAQMTWLE